MKRLHALLGLGAASLGWPGMLGLGLLVAIGGFYVSALAPQQKLIDDLRQESLQLRERAKRPNNDAPQAPAEKLAAFYGFFPPPKELPDLLEKPLSWLSALGRQSLVAYMVSLQLTYGGTAGMMGLMHAVTLPLLLSTVANMVVAMVVVSRAWEWWLAWEKQRLTAAAAQGASPA